MYKAIGLSIAIVPNRWTFSLNSHKWCRMFRLSKKLSINACTNIERPANKCEWNGWDCCNYILYEYMGMKNKFARLVPRLLTLENMHNRIYISMKCVTKFNRNPKELLAPFLIYVWVGFIYCHIQCSNLTYYLVIWSYVPYKWCGVKVLLLMLLLMHFSFIVA